MDADIRRTTVTPTEGGNVVHVHISDAPLEAPFASIELQMTVLLPRYAQALMVEQAQREAMSVAQGVLSDHLQRLAARIQNTEVRLHPTVLEND